MSNKCPKCGKEIEYLVNWVAGEKSYEFDGETYDSDDFMDNCTVNDYECPECSETLFTDEEKAKKFLKKKKGE